VQRDTNTIFLSGPVARPDLNVNENQETRFTAISTSFPKAVDFMMASRRRGTRSCRALRLCA